MAKNPIERTPHRRLTKKQLKQLASFTDPATVLAALAKEDWTIEESIQHIVDIAKGEVGGTKTSTRLNAIKYLNQLIIDAMERSGLMIMASKKYVGKDGEEIRFSGHVVSSVLRGQKEQTTPAKLLTDTIKKEGNNGNGGSKKCKNGKDESGEEGEERTRRAQEGNHLDNIPKGDKGRQRREQEDSLFTSKPPTGREAESGHFAGLAERSAGEVDEDNSGDFL